MYTFTVSALLLIAVASFILALVFDYFPFLAKRYDALMEGQKRCVMAMVLLLTAIVIFALGCLDLFVTNIACSVNGVVVLVGYVLEAVTVNQSTHSLFKPTETLRAKMFGLKKGKK